MQATIKDIVDFYNTFPQFIGEINVKTRFGYKKIEAAAMTAKNSDVIKITTDSGEVLKTSPEHLLLSDNIEWINAKNLKVGSFLFKEDSITKVKSIKLLKTKQNLYDLQVADVHEFFANGIVSHNSSILDVICYSLFGKPFRNINLKQLKNYKNNSDLLCEIEFTVAGREYLIRRGMHPVVFEVYQDGAMLNQDGSKLDYQRYLEENIIHFNFTTFTQIVILGKATYVSFMQLKPAARRQFIETVLGAEVFGIMAELHKSNIANIKDEIAEIKTECRVLKSIIEHGQARIIKEKALAETEIAEKKLLLSQSIDSLSKKIDSMKIEQSDLLNKIDSTAQDRHSAVTKRMLQLTKLQAKTSTMIQHIEKQLQFFSDNTTCPSCDQTICEHTKSEKMAGFSLELDRLNKILSELSDKHNTTSEEISHTNKILERNSEIKSAIASLRAHIASSEVQLEKYKKEINEVSTYIDTEQEELEIKESENKLAVLVERRGELMSKELDNTLISQMLKDSGIKRMIVQKYLPLINSLVNTYLERLGFTAKFSLDDEFQETITAMGLHELSYYNFSEGEKLRIDLALLMAWREIATLRNNMSTNLLIFDEVLDASLDQNGIDALVGLFETIPNSNIIVITHSHEELKDVFESQITFEKIGGFSRIQEQRE